MAHNRLSFIGDSLKGSVGFPAASLALIGNEKYFFNFSFIECYETYKTIDLTELKGEILSKLRQFSDPASDYTFYCFISDKNIENLFVTESI